MNTKEILTNIKTRLESGWTQLVSARNSEGKEVDALSPDACKWCMVGALEAETKDPDDYRKMHRLLRQHTMGSISKFNDSHSKSEVLALLDQAIKAES